MLTNTKGLIWKVLIILACIIIFILFRYRRTRKQRSRSKTKRKESQDSGCGKSIGSWYNPFVWNDAHIADKDMRAVQEVWHTGSVCRKFEILYTHIKMNWLSLRRITHGNKTSFRFFTRRVQYISGEYGKDGGQMWIIKSNDFAAVPHAFSGTWWLNRHKYWFTADIVVDVYLWKCYNTNEQFGSKIKKPRR